MRKRSFKPTKETKDKFIKAFGLPLVDIILILALFAVIVIIGSLFLFKVI